MLRQKAKSLSHAAPVRWIAVYCLLSVLLLAGAQAFHSHSGNLPEQTKECSICPSIVAAVMPTHTATFNVETTLQEFIVRSADHQAKNPLASASIFIRPPPVV